MWLFLLPFIDELSCLTRLVGLAGLHQVLVAVDDAGHVGAEAEDALQVSVGHGLKR